MDSRTLLVAPAIRPPSRWACGPEGLRGAATRRHRGFSGRPWLVLALVCTVGAPAATQSRAARDVQPVSYDELYDRYLQTARATVPPPAGMDASWMIGLATDARARRVNDLVTIRVVESISASGAAASSLDKRSSAAVPFPRLFGLEDRLPVVTPGAPLQASSETQFRGTGATRRSGELSAILTARVVDVLPNGDLMLEGVREIDINGDRQVVVLTGVLRTADIHQGNVALSTSIGQLRIRYFGKGLIRDNLQPGWLIRVLNRIF